MKNNIQINSTRSIGDDNPTFIIAEIGSNHNKDFNIALRIIDTVAESKADAVKFQLFRAERVYSKKTPLFEGTNKHIIDILKEVELPRNWIPKLKKYTESKGLIFFSTVTDYQDVDLLQKFDVPLYKIGSFEIVDLQLLEYTAKKMKPIIISTGLANLEEIEDAYVTIKKTGNKDIVFLQCVSVYPANPRTMNLKAMNTIKNAFPDTVVGLSDHTMGIHVSIAAVAMGAKVIEKHFTLDRNMKGPDHTFAIEPYELKGLVRQIRDVESALGNGQKLGPSKEEKENYEKARRSIHAKIDIVKGMKITEDMLIIKRPGYGIKPKFIDIILGREAKTNIEEDQWITWDMI